MTESNYQFMERHRSKNRLMEQGYYNKKNEEYAEEIKKADAQRRKQLKRNFYEDRSCIEPDAMNQLKYYMMKDVKDTDKHRNSGRTKLPRANTTALYERR